MSTTHTAPTNPIAPRLRAEAAIYQASVCLDRATDMRSSAVTTLEQARECLSEGFAGPARAWALKSLAYSVGVFAPEYADAKAGVVR